VRINGTFDWVYEEELNLRDGFRWSPDGQSLAFWQIDVEGVKSFHLVHNVEGLYSRVQSIPYPKAGETNPAARIGVVSASGGETRWMPIPGDPREHYLAQMDWAGDARHLAIQQFNRLQNVNRLMLVEIATGQIQTVLSESDAAWVENNNSPLHWIENHAALVWLSERDGWQRAYRVSRADGQSSPITTGDFDVVSIDAIDKQGGWLYYLASPQNPTQRYNV
jgi:dipeptidyl-peptidase-4